jgi:transposase InsO family protein
MLDRSISRRYRWKVQGRLAVLEYATYGIRPAAARFGLDRKTVRAWRARFREVGTVGLVPRYPKRRRRRIPDSVVEVIAHARRELGWGACRIRLWLLRVHHVKVAPGTISSVQIDVKFVKVGGVRAYQYTALDECTRLRVLRLYRRLHVLSSLDFLAEVVRAFPFGIRRIQTDHGAEFPFRFVLAVEHLGIRHRYIRPRCPAENGKAATESTRRSSGTATASRPLRALLPSSLGERIYNEQRFSMALNGRTPAEKLAAVLRQRDLDDAEQQLTTPGSPGSRS